MFLGVKEMKLEPVEKADPPAYPAGEALQSVQGLLSPHVPRRWRAATCLAGALWLLVVAGAIWGARAAIVPPAYPTRDNLPAEKAPDASLLHLWQKAEGVAGELAAALARICGCGGCDAGHSVTPPPGLTASDPLVEQAAEWVASICRDPPTKRLGRNYNRLRSF